MIQAKPATPKPRSFAMAGIAITTAVTSNSVRKLLVPSASVTRRERRCPMASSDMPSLTRPPSPHRRRRVFKSKPRSGGLLLLHRRPGEFRVVQQHHPVDIGGEVGELFGPLPQRRVEERRQDSGERAE